MDQNYKKFVFDRAKNGDSGNQLLIANAYLDGTELVDYEKNYEKAFYWYHKAAQKNNIFAFAELARMYMLGRYVPIDLNKAYVYLTQFVLNEHREPNHYLYTNFVYYNLGIIYRDGLSFEGKNINKAKECLLKVIKSTSNELKGDAYCNLGIIYIGENKIVTGANYLHESMVLKHPAGTFNLGILYVQGIFGEEARLDGVKLIRRAEQLGHPNAILKARSEGFDV